MGSAKHLADGDLWTSGPGGGVRWSARVVDLLDGARPGGTAGDPAAWPVWQQLLPHVLAATAAGRHPDPADEVALKASLLLDRVGRYRRSRGEPSGSEYERGRELDEQLLLLLLLLLLRRRELGDDHPDTLWAAHNLAVDLSALGEHDQARILAEDTLTRCRRVLGDDHPDTLRSEANLAEDLRALGEDQH